MKTGSRYYWVDNDMGVVSGPFTSEAEARTSAQQGAEFVCECTEFPSYGLPSLFMVEEPILSFLEQSLDEELDFSYKISREQAERELRIALFSWARKNLLLVREED